MTERIAEHLTLAREERLAIVTIDRGDGRNALSLALLKNLRDLARRLADEPALSAVIVTGAGAFSAGADLADPALAERAAADLAHRRHMLRAGPDMVEAWAALEPVTIAAVEKHCVGGGVSLATACDFRIAGASAHFRLPEVPLGMNMSWRTVPRLVRLMGPARAKRFVLLGERLAAADAAAQGLCDETVPDGSALDAALCLARRIAALPPVAVRMAKEAVDAAAHALDRATSVMDRDVFGLAATGADHREAIAAFLEKRPPRFTGG